MYKYPSARTGPVTRPGSSFLCAKFGDVHKVMVHAKFQSSKTLGFRHKDF